MTSNPAAAPDPAAPIGCPLVAPRDRFAAYRQLLASPRDEEVCWWYFGTTFVKATGLPAVAVINASTLMIVRAETLSDDSFAIHWDEIGYFSDYVTGSPLAYWTNPLTGRRLPSPQSFAEGPARYAVVRAVDGVAVTLSQPGATVNSIEVKWTSVGDRVRVVQQERKTRGFPDVDGRLPDPASTAGFEAVTNLAFIDQWPGGGSNTHGLYDFALAGTPPWMGFDRLSNSRAKVRGVIVKATPAAPPRSDALTILQTLYPDFFARHGH